nr:copia protein [Tanacetum cinerariifolium]
MTKAQDQRSHGIKEQACNIIKTKDLRTQRQSNLNKSKEARFKISPQEFEDHTLREIKNHFETYVKSKDIDIWHIIVHVLAKDSDISKRKKEKYKLLALNARKVLSEEEASSSDSEDEEYAMVVRDFKKFFRRGGKFVRQPHDDKNNFQKNEEDKKEKEDLSSSLQEMLEMQKPPKDKHGIGYTEDIASTSNVKTKKLSPKDDKMSYVEPTLLVPFARELASSNGHNRLSAENARTLESNEFDNEVQFGASCDANGITNNFSAPRTPQSNEVRFDESSPSKSSPLVDDDILESEIIENQEKDLEIKKNEPLNKEIVNIKEIKDHPIDSVIGYNQKEGIDFDETYAPIARLESIRILFAYACAHDFKLFPMDVKSTFLNGFINEEVYVAQPSGFVDFEKPNHVFKLKKALYGLKQVPK